MRLIKKSTAVLVLAVVLLVMMISGCDPVVSGESVTGGVSAKTPAPAQVSAEPAPIQTAATVTPNAPARSQTPDTPDVPETQPESEDAWTLLVYLCGTDLEENYGMASGNLAEMLAVPAADNVNIVIQTGGTKEWKTDGIDATKLQRFELAGGEMRLVDEQPLTSMGSPLTLYNFLSWGVDNYPAEKTGFVFWNHGGGSIGGAEVDQYFRPDVLTLAEMREAFAAAGTEEEFEFIGFDACLMATLETALILEPYAKYLVASEETEAGAGWDYVPIVNALNDTPDITGDALGTMICDSFYAKCAQNGTENMATLSVTDLSKVEGVADAWEEVAAELAANAADIGSLGDIA
ncbi:MAG TPA: hypothetical protein DEB31_02670, partial [Clostridiales bacterium]|nr:hypothetical protein [Clostridiales bacterium]